MTLLSSLFLFHYRAVLALRGRIIGVHRQMQAELGPAGPAINFDQPTMIGDDLRHQRQTHVPMEGRAIVASLQGTGELLVYVSCQSPHMAARYISKTFEIPDQNVRVISKDVGGAFGQKVAMEAATNTDE